MVMAAKMIRSISHSRSNRHDLLKAISDGIRLGLEADSFLAVEWEDNWQMPLQSLREKLKIDKITPAMAS